MSYKTVSIETEKQRQRALDVDTQLPYQVAGEMKSVPLRKSAGELEMPVLSKPMGELITTADGLSELVESVVLDVELGRERVPVLYSPIYDRLEDAEFPEVFDAKWALEGRVVFVQRLENEEVTFGTLAAEEGPIARIKSYAAGFEYTEEMLMYNQAFNVQVLNRSMGEAYNALLNHIHLDPIVSASYDADHSTDPQGDDDEYYPIQIRKTLKQGLIDAASKGRPATVLLAPPALQWDIEEALRRHVISGTEYPELGGVDTVIYYGGWETKVGEKTYSYDGVGSTDAYLIRPTRGFKELVKRDLMVDAQPGPISRLIEEQIVGRAHRGVFAAIDENVQKLDLTEQTS